MPLPSALVRVKLKRLIGIDPAALDRADRALVVARIGRRRLGPSAVLARGATSYTFPDGPWGHALAVDPGEAISIVASVYGDYPSRAPNLLTSIGATISDPWDAGTHTSGPEGGIQLEYEVLTSHVPGGRRPLHAARRTVGEEAVTTFVLANSVVVELTNIRGLYAPSATAGELPAPRAGYRSEDDLGRVYTSRDLDNNFLKNTQQIELAVRLHVRGNALPSGAKVRWRIEDADDPSDIWLPSSATGLAPTVHRQWSRLMDPHDYRDETSGESIGVQGADNEGAPQKDPRWEAVGSFGVDAPDATSAKTNVVGGESKVLLHCPHIGGDRLIVHVDVVDATGFAVYGARTGVMTMWKRIQVQYVRMRGAHDMPVALVPQHYEPAFVQMEMVASPPIDDIEHLARNDDGVERASSQLVERAFTHKADKGWFCVIGAMLPHPITAAQRSRDRSAAPLLHEGDAKVKTGHNNTITGWLRGPQSYIEVPRYFQHRGHAQTLIITFRHPSDNVEYDVPFHCYSTVRTADGKTRVWIVPHDITPDFTAGNGSQAHAYLTRRLFYPTGSKDGGGAWTPGAYQIPEDVTVKIYGERLGFTGGISPDPAGHPDYFAGRTIVFTHHPAYFEPQADGSITEHTDVLVGTIVHELTHAFGTPHKCGQFSYKTPRAHTCSMNYPIHWMLEEGTNLLIPGTSRIDAPPMCGRHLKVIRQTVLETNDALGWGR